MRVMALIKANENTEAGVMPSEQLLTEMGRFNEELAEAGLLKGGDGLHPSSKGARVTFEGDQVSVTDGPFADTRELIAGYWIWEVESLQEAIDWARRCPNRSPEGGRSEIEIRSVFAAEDFGEALTPELRAREEELRARADDR